ncbi:thioesterase [Clostridium sp. C8-1-8]|uniref:thioesterase II family protein n=1 Tax=Clostridium sp. C8-1-8 TaxID=2698831 RepID=UPI00136D292F|nr:thioesterase [Clostridium sp. C8-1-8]
MRLFCFPYAGGSATVYSKWKKMVNSSIEIVPVEFPGRGIRFNEKLCDNMKKLVDDVYNSLEKSLIEDEYMLYGHSMGGLFVYYLTNKIVKSGIRLPSRLFISGRRAPHINKSSEFFYEMTDKEFVSKIYEIGGTPKELIENEEMLKIYIPIIKNDYRLVETCLYEKPVKIFDFDITIFNGIEDDLDKEDIEEWSRYTSKKFISYNFNGGHFFIRDYGKEILDIIYNQTKQGTS